MRRQVQNVINLLVPLKSRYKRFKSSLFARLNLSPKKYQQIRIGFILALISAVPIILILTLFHDTENRSVSGVTTPTTTTTSNNYYATPTPTPIYGISGKVYVDKNLDGKMSSSETGVEGVTVKLLKTGITTPFKVDETDIDGDYAFVKLTSGNYVVDIDAPSGYRKATPAPVAVVYKRGALIVNFGLEKSDFSPTPTPIKEVEEETLVKNSSFDPIVIIAAVSFLLLSVFAFLLYKRSKKNGTI